MTYGKEGGPYSKTTEEKFIYTSGMSRLPLVTNPTCICRFDAQGRRIGPSYYCCRTDVVEHFNRDPRGYSSAYPYTHSQLDAWEKEYGFYKVAKAIMKLPSYMFYPGTDSPTTVAPFIASSHLLFGGCVDFFEGLSEQPNVRTRRVNDPFIMLNKLLFRGECDVTAGLMRVEIPATESSAAGGGRAKAPTPFKVVPVLKPTRPRASPVKREFTGSVCGIEIKVCVCVSPRRCDLVVPGAPPRPQPPIDRRQVEAVLEPVVPQSPVSTVVAPVEAVPTPQPIVTGQGETGTSVAPAPVVVAVAAPAAAPAPAVKRTYTSWARAVDSGNPADGSSVSVSDSDDATPQPTFLVRKPNYQPNPKATKQSLPIPPSVSGGGSGGGAGGRNSIVARGDLREKLGPDTGMKYHAFNKWRAGRKGVNTVGKSARYLGKDINCESELLVRLCLTNFNEDRASRRYFSLYNVRDIVMELTPVLDVFRMGNDAPEVYVTIPCEFGGRTCEEVCATLQASGLKLDGAELHWNLE